MRALRSHEEQQASVGIQTGLLTYNGPERRSTSNAGAAAALTRNRRRRYPDAHPVAMAVDALLVMLGLGVGIWVWVLDHDPSYAHDASTLVWFSLASLPVWLVVFRWQHMYAERDASRLISDVLRVFNSVVLGSVAYIVLAWMVDLEVPRAALLVAMVVMVVTQILARHVVRVEVRRRRRKGIGLQPVAILGANAEAIGLAESLMDPVLGRDVVGFISTQPNVPEVLCGLPVHVTSDPAVKATKLGVEAVVIATTALDSTAPTGLVRSLLDRNIEIEMTSALTGVANDRIHVHAVGPFPLIRIDPGYRGGWRAMAKRVFDVVVATVMLVLISPLLGAALLAVRLESAGPVFYSQDRLGRRGVGFRVHKVRTMVVGADQMKAELAAQNDSDGPLFKMEQDPRVTKVGRVLRKFSIDEIPQLWNVVQGDMSLVGPRPALADEAEEWSEELHNRLRVRPGITGMWQVNGRSSTTFSEYERLDLFYIDNWSMLTDLGILVRTIPAVVSRKGAS